MKGAVAAFGAAAALAVEGILAAPLVRAAGSGEKMAAPRLVARTWTTDEGLPQNSVTSIVQTRDGQLWLATLGGLVRFDGLQFTGLTTASTPALRSNRVTALLETTRGDLWVGTENGSVTCLARGGRLFTIGRAEGFPSAGVTQLVEGRDGGVWIGTERGLVRWAAAGLRLYLPSLRIYSVLEAADDTTWVGTTDGVWSIQDGQVARELETHRPAYALALGPDGTLWVGSDSLHRLSRHGAERIPVPGIRTFTTMVVDRGGALWAGGLGGLARVSAGRVTAFRAFAPAPLVVNLAVEAPDGALWFGLIGGRLVRFEQGRFEILQRDRRVPGPDLVRAVTFDRAGNAWVGYDISGVTRWRPGEVGALTCQDGLPARSVLPIVEDRRGTIWLGTWCGGLVELDAGRVSVYERRHGLPNLCVAALLEDRAGHLWVGTLAGLVRRTAPAFEPAGIARAVYALHEDPRGNLWVGTARGLARLSGDRLTWFTTIEGLVNDDVRFVTSDRKGALLVGTVGGMSRFADGRFTNFTRADGLPHDYVRAIHEDEEGALWIGTYGGGLARFRDGRFAALTTRDGLAEDVVSRIIENGRGTFWMTGNRGVSRIPRRELDEYLAGHRSRLWPMLYTAADGMPVSETNGGTQPSGWLARDGRLWIPTIDGVAVIDPEARAAGPGPPVFIERVLVDGATVATGPRVDVPPGRHGVEIHFTALSLSAAEGVRFRYRLEGHDEGWVHVGAQRVAHYARLAPGVYTFRVAASNARGAWSPSEATVVLLAAPAWWQTWHARVAGALGLAALALGLYRARVRILQRRHARQVAFSRRLIEAQEAERRRVAAELHDGVGQRLAIIRKRALLALGGGADGQPIRDHLEKIGDATRAALDEVRRVARSLRPYQIDRLGLGPALVGMIRDAEEASGIRFSVSIDDVCSSLDLEVQAGLFRIL